MRNIFLAILLFIINIIPVYAENNTTMLSVSTKSPSALTLDDIDKIGSIMEPAAEILSKQIDSFGIMLTIIVTLLSLFAYVSVFKPIKEKMDKIDKSIAEQVKSQIIYGIDDELEKATKYAQKKIDEEVKNIKLGAKQSLFEYQDLVYLINQKQKDDCNEILEKKDLSDMQKFKQMINIQFEYNDIVNDYLPKLLNSDFSVIKQTIKALSEYNSIKSLIKEHLSDKYQNGKYTYKQKEDIKLLLKRYYD